MTTYEVSDVSLLTLPLAAHITLIAAARNIVGRHGC